MGEPVKYTIEPPAQQSKYQVEPPTQTASAKPQDWRDNVINSLGPDTNGDHPIKNSLLGAGQGIAQMVLHPVDSLFQNPHSGGNGYPGTTYTGVPSVDAANASDFDRRQEEAVSQAGQLKHDFELSPAHTVSKIVAPIALGYGLSEAAPYVSEAMKGGAGNIIDRTAGVLKSDVAHGAQPGRAYLEGGGKPALTMRGIAKQAEGIKQATGEQLGEAYKNATGDVVPQRPPKGALPAAPLEVPLGEPPAPINVPGELIPAAKLPSRNVVGESAAGPINAVGENVTDSVGSQGAAVPPRVYRQGYVTEGEYPPTESPQGPSGPGVMVTRDPAVANQFVRPSNQSYNVPVLHSGITIPTEDVRGVVSAPIRKLYSLQEGPGGTGVSPQLDEYRMRVMSPISEAETRGGFTPAEVFEMKKNIAGNTNWKDPTMFDLNNVRQQTVGGLGELLTDAVPETGRLNKIYQGNERLANRANLRADTGQSPLTTITRRGAEAALGLGLGYGTGNPLYSIIPLALDTVPARTTAAYGMFNAGKGLPVIAPASLPLGAGAGTTKRVNDEEPESKNRK